MPSFKDGKTAQADYFRAMDRMIETNPHKVYVIQDKRTLRNTAKDLGIEFLVGDKKHDKEQDQGIKVEMEHYETLKKFAQQLKANPNDAKVQKLIMEAIEGIVRDHRAEVKKYYPKLLKFVEKSHESVFLDLEKAGDSFKFDPNSTENEGRWRLADPKNITDYFRRSSSTPGVSYVMGKDKAGKEVVQAIRFDKSKFTEAQAGKWWQKNATRFTKTWSWNKSELAKGKAGEDAEHHRYLKKYKTPSGNFVYAYNVS